MGNHQELDDFLRECKSQVSPVLFSYLKCEPKEYQGLINEYPERMGKYLRPALIMLSAKLHGGNPKEALKVAAAMQASEEWVLVHDDAEDHSTERRSTKEEFKPSLNSMVGWEIAINVGDTLHAIMWKILGDAVRDKPNGWQIFDKMFDIILRTTEGQYMELDWIHNRKTEVCEDDYFRMIDKKTAYYSIIGPIQLGSLVARVNPKDILSISNFGTPLGRSFQLRDDVINLIQESKIAGKKQYGDIIEGKRTLILTHLLEHSNLTEVEYIKTIYRSESRSKEQEEIEYIVKLMQKYKSIEYADNLALRYSRQAKEEFQKYCKGLNNPDTTSKKLMLDLIELIATRTQ